MFLSTLKKLCLYYYMIIIKNLLYILIINFHFADFCYSLGFACLPA